MAPFDEDLLSWVREVRGAKDLQADPGRLEEARGFLRLHEAENVRSATHSLLENYPDWWVRQKRAPPGLELERPEDLEEFYRHAGYLHGLGIPLTLSEKRTSAFRFFQDVEAWGTRDGSVPADDLVGPECCLSLYLAQVVGEVFSNHKGFLDAAVFDATGLSQTRGIRKTSVRLVWPSIVVDSDRAARVRDLVVHRLSTASVSDDEVAELEAKLKDQSPSNAWHNVLGDAAYGSKAGVRMPLNDRVSPLPLRAPERRPLSPSGVLRFTFEGTGLPKAEWLCRDDELDGSEWIKIGCLRQPAETPLTGWSVPTWPGTQPIPPSTTRTGRVKVRTAGGSDGGTGGPGGALSGGGGVRARTSRAQAAPERAGQIVTVERQFTTTMEQFSERMEQHLGKASIDADGALVWRQRDGDARIVLHKEDRRVQVVGRSNQVRSLVVIVAPYTEAVSQPLAHSFSEAASEAGQSRTMAQRGLGAVYAPSRSQQPRGTSDAEAPRHYKGEAGEREQDEKDVDPNGR